MDKPTDFTKSFQRLCCHCENWQGGQELIPAKVAFDASQKEDNVIPINKMTNDINSTGYDSPHPFHQLTNWKP